MFWCVQRGTSFLVPAFWCRLLRLSQIFSITGFWSISDSIRYPLVMTNVAKITMNSGFSHEKMVIFNSYVSHNQRVIEAASYFSIPESAGLKPMTWWKNVLLWCGTSRVSSCVIRIDSEFTRPCRDLTNLLKTSGSSGLWWFLGGGCPI